MACCSRPGTARRTCTTTLKNVGLQNASKPCSLTNRGWAGMPFAVSGTRGCGGGGQEDIKNFWLGPKPRTMSEQYSHLFAEVELRLAEGGQVGVGFDIPAYIGPNCSKGSLLSDVQVN